MAPSARSLFERLIASDEVRARRRLRRLAAAQGVDVMWTIAPDAHVGTNVVLQSWAPGARCHVTIGPGARLEDGSTLRLKGGATVSIGPRAVVRSGAVLNVGGRLDLAGDNLISWHCVIHAGDAVVFERFAGTGEMVTVVDSDHLRSDPEEHWYHSAEHAPVVIGRNTWLGAKCTVMRGVAIGANATVAAHSVVRDDVPEGATVAGAPARVVGSGGRGPAAVPGSETSS